MEWFIKDLCGYVCIFFTYFTLAVVDMGVIFFSIKDQLLNGDVVAIIHTVIFNSIIFIISASHIKCMTTDPGTVPFKKLHLNYSKLPNQTKNLIAELKSQLKDNPKAKSLVQDQNYGNVLTVDDLEKAYEHNQKNKNKKRKIMSLNSLSRNQNFGHRANKRAKSNFHQDQEYEHQSQHDSQDRSDSQDQEVALSGTMTRSDVLLKALSRKCKRCDCVKPPKSHHCSTCGRCIARMDHHCPWVNNCVGYYNQKFFLLFLFYVIVGCTYAGILFFFKVRTCNKANRFCNILGDTKLIVLGVLNVFLILLFVLFCFVMLIDQVNCIVSEKSTIERIQKAEVQRQRKSSESLQRVFGGKFGLHWFIPSTITNKMIVEGEY